MQFYNTRSRAKEEFKPVQVGKVNIYSCGPTVYDRLHIGNWSSYVRWDTLVRLLSSSGLEVKRIINITDVGHLVSDSDEGEDKLEVGARREGLDAWQIAEKYYLDFLAGYKNLGLVEPERFAKATEHIEGQIGLIKILESKNYTYIIGDGVYFDTAKFAGYADFARLNLKDQIHGHRVKFNSEKKNISDFALWKFSPKNAQRHMEWESPWGKGFPGWHIECSAMALKYFNNHLDIHTGGIDHIPVHHTNEIAQSETATRHKFGNFWLHNNFLLANGTKISKSLKNGYTLDDLQSKGFSLEEFKLFVHQSHYRSESNFTWENLSSAKLRLKSYQALADLRWQPVKNSSFDLVQIEKYKNSFIEALQDDMDTPKSLAILSDFQNKVAEQGIDAKGIKTFVSFIKSIDNLLGLSLSKTQDIEPSIKSIIEKRQLARDSKDWTEADRLRRQILSFGIKIEDSPTGGFWSRV